MLNSAIRVSDSNIDGVGIISTTHIPAGEIVYAFDDTKPPVHVHETIYMTQEDRFEFARYAIQTGDDEYCFKQGDINLINHSCEPTCWWEENGILIARRDIQPGDEISYDYPTTDIRRHYRMNCACGNKSCRNIFSNKDYLQIDFQQKYAGHLLNHVMEAIRRKNANEPDPNQPDLDNVPSEVFAEVRLTLSQAKEFQSKYGPRYVFEMMKHTILRLQSGGSCAEIIPKHLRKFDDKYIYRLVRKLILHTIHN